MATSREAPQIVVPYIVMNLEEGKSKALFGVPKEMASTMTEHPVMCRGGCFTLEIDTSEAAKNADQQTRFIAAIYESVDAEATAEEISNRLAVRLGDPVPMHANSILGIGPRPSLTK